jgi:hypothetical protein
MVIAQRGVDFLAQRNRVHGAVGGEQWDATGGRATYDLSHPNRNATRVICLVIRGVVTVFTSSTGSLSSGLPGVLNCTLF